MENASKALIIAGAILLSILIISLGIMVYNNAKNAANGGNIDKTQIQGFNSEWEGYVGNNRTADQIRSLYQAVIASNAAETKAGTNRLIGIKKAATAGTAYTAANKPTSVPTIANNATYTVVVGYDATTGLVVEIAYN